MHQEVLDAKTDWLTICLKVTCTFSICFVVSSHTYPNVWGGLLFWGWRYKCVSVKGLGWLRKKMKSDIHRYIQRLCYSRTHSIKSNHVIHALLHWNTVNTTKHTYLWRHAQPRPYGSYENTLTMGTRVWFAHLATCTSTIHTHTHTLVTLS
jgi:hypothetical protein